MIEPPEAQPRSVLPDYSGRGLANVTPTVCRILGADLDGLLPPLAEDVLPSAFLDGVDTVVLMLVDGLGYGQLQRGIEQGDTPALATIRANVERGTAHLAAITSVFPSATMAALASVHTGTAPARHGVLGWTLFLEEFGQATEMARWGPADKPGVSYQDKKQGAHDPTTFLGVPTIYQRLATAGVPSFIVNPAEYRGTALSRMLFNGAEEVWFRAGSGLGVNLERVLEGPSRGARRMIYGYYPGLDTTAHLFGPHSLEHRAEIAGFDFILGRWLGRARGDERTLILLTADHGHVFTPPAHTVYVDQPADLIRRLRCPPTGERRMLYLHPRESGDQELRAQVERLWGHAADLVPSAQALEQGWFGPGEVSDAARRRAGELLVIPRDDWQLTYSARPDRPVKAFSGNHGALDPAEMLVPLLAWRI